MYEIQLQWIRDLHQALRSPWMDGLFKAWDYVDTGYFNIIVIALVWYLWDRRIGIRLFYILVISFALNQSLKLLFHQPRPCHDDPLVGIVCATSFGFPSGAAQSAAILGGILVLECRRALYRWLGVLFALMLCFSRICLGMHYFTDILGGLVVGCLLLCVYKKVFPLFERVWEIAAVVFSFALLLPVLFLPIPWSWGLYLFFSTLGVACGLLTYAKKIVGRIESLSLRLEQFFSVIGGLFVLFALGHYLPRLEILWDFAEGYWLSFLGGYFVLSLRKNRPA